MNANPNVDKGPRIPRQVVAQAARARALLGEGQDPIPEATQSAEPANAPSAPAPVFFTAEELLKAPDKERDQSRDYWYARSQAVEGFRRDENARSRDKITKLEAQVQSLSAKVDELSSKQQASAQPAIDLRQHFNEEEIDSIGEERAAAILRAAMSSTESIVRQRIDAAVKPLLDKKNADEQNTEEQLQAKFIEDLTEGFPTWQVTDKDVRWLKWLSGKDENSGMIRQRLVNIHRQDRNASGIVKLLNEFVSSLSPAPVQPLPETPAAILGGSPDEPVPENPSFVEGRALTEKEIKDGYKRKSLGKMTREEALRFDKQVAAQMQQQGRS